MFAVGRSPDSDAVVLQRSHQAKSAFLLGAREGRVSQKVGSTLLREKLMTTSASQSKLQRHVLE